LQWYDLEGVDTGRIKLRANWKHLNNNPASLQQVKLLLLLLLQLFFGLNGIAHFSRVTVRV